MWAAQFSMTKSGLSPRLRSWNQLSLYFMSAVKDGGLPFVLYIVFACTFFVYTQKKCTRRQLMPVGNSGSYVNRYMQPQAMRQIHQGIQAEFIHLAFHQRTDTGLRNL